MSIQGSNVSSNGQVPFVEKFPGTTVNLPTDPTGNSKAETQVEKNVSKADVERAVESLNKFMQTKSTYLKFTLHEELNEYYVQVISDGDKEVVREIPSKKVLDMVAKMHEMIGLLVDEKR